MTNLKKFIRAILPIFLVFTLFSACNDEIDDKIETSKSIQKTIDQQKNEYLKGQIFSILSESPINRVTIKRKNEIIAVSDQEGNFAIDAREIPKEGAIYIFEHSDYATVSKRIKPNSKLNIMMKDRSAPFIIDSRKGGEIRVGKEGFLNISSDAFLYEGKPYDGPVSIRTTFLDATNPTDLFAAPGSFIADEGNGERLYPLTSYGMIEVTATIPEKNLPLELNPKTPIEIGFPITVKDTPDRVNLYVMNIETGYWELLGVLINRGTNLIGEITSVNSNWNADQPCSESLICVEVQVLYSNDNLGCDISAIGETYQGVDGPYTPDANGIVELMVCPDSIFTIGACQDSASSNYQFTTSIDMTGITPDPSGCTSLGIWVIDN